MKKSNQPLSELKDFIRHQAAEDAVLAPSERRYQAELVKDVLRQEASGPNALKVLWSDYSKQVSGHLAAR